MSDIYCIYHPIDGALTVTAQERDDLLKTGTWFDSPADADRYRDQIEQDLLNEQKNREEEMLKKDREAHQIENPAQAEDQNDQQPADQKNDQENDQDGKPKRKRAQKKFKNDSTANDDFLVQQENDDKPDFAAFADLKPEDTEHEDAK